MFDVLFGWKKASKCKKLIRRVQLRLRLLRNKRDSIVRSLREDVSRLVEMGYLEIATKREEQLLKDETVMDIYDLLNNFCELIVTNMSYIRRHRECPNDVNEAVSSLIFASARCGELPELRRIRELFRERYGERFALVAVDLLPGNFVNPKIREQLSMKVISNDSKFSITDEIARHQLGIQPEILSIEHDSELHKKIEEMAEQQAVCLEIVPISPVIVADSKQEDIRMTEVEKNEAVFASVVAGIGQKSEKSRFQMQLLPKSASPKGDRFAIVPPPYELNATIQCSEGKEGGGMLDKASEQMDGTLTSSSAESSPQFTDLKVVYLDDVEEVQSSPKPDAEGLDQRLFKFNRSVVPKVEKTEGITSKKDNPSLKASRRSKIPSGKRFRRRSVSREPESIDNVEDTVYYSAPPGNLKKHPKQSQTEIKGRAVDSKPKNYQGRTCKVFACARQESHCNCCLCRKARDQEVFDARPSHTEGLGGKPHVVPDDSSDTGASSSRSVVEDDSLLPSYVRAMTMPPKRQTVRPDSEEGKIPRSNSCPFGQQPNHVHPKLPDYDELAAKFSALKKEFLGTGPMLRTAKHV